MKKCEYCKKLIWKKPYIVKFITYEKSVMGMRGGPIFYKKVKIHPWCLAEIKSPLYDEDLKKKAKREKEERIQKLKDEYLKNGSEN